MAALVSGGRSTLNPNAPLFIPSYVRQVDDFSPEWWDLVTTSAWFHEYWLSQHQGEEDVFGQEQDDSVEGLLLPDNIDVGVDEEILSMEAQFEEFLKSREAEYASKTTIFGQGAYDNGNKKNGFAVMNSLDVVPKERGIRSPRESIKLWDKPAKIVSPKRSPRFIQQPR